MADHRTPFTISSLIGLGEDERCEAVARAPDAKNVDPAARTKMFTDQWKRVSDRRVKQAGRLPAEWRPTDGRGGLLAASLGRGDVISIEGSEPLEVAGVVTSANPSDPTEEVTFIDAGGRGFEVPGGSRVQVLNLASTPPTRATGGDPRPETAASAGQPAGTSAITQQPVSSGGLLASCTMSPIVGGIIRTTAGDEQRLWHVNEPEEARKYLGQGRIARTPVGAARFREVGQLDPKQGVLQLPDRRPGSDGRIPTIGVLSLRPTVGEVAPPPGDTGQREVGMGVLQALQVVFSESGMLILERTRPETGEKPWLRFFLRRKQLSVWTSPVPTASELWGPQTTAKDEVGVLLPVDQNLPPKVLALVVRTVAGWGVSPWDLSLTFIPPADAS